MNRGKNLWTSHTRSPVNCVTFHVLIMHDKTQSTEVQSGQSDRASTLKAH